MEKQDNKIGKEELSNEHLERIDAYWRASNYLSVGQIYLRDNPLMREPLKPEHIKPMLLGHWGTTPGQNFIYVHLNRIIKKYDLNESRSFYNIDVELFNDMANIKNVYLIENKNRKEIKELEAKTANE